jgi:hypothetical protein
MWKQQWDREWARAVSVNNSSDYLWSGGLDAPGAFPNLFAKSAGRTLEALGMSRSVHTNPHIFSNPTFPLTILLLIHVFRFISFQLEP